MPKPESFPIETIFVPTKLKKTLKPETVGEIAESMLDIGQQTPISVWRDGDRLVLVEGLHRLEACKALGETTILGVLVSAEFAERKPQLAERPEVEAERLKMARLKQLRLEKEAAEAATAASRGNATQAPRARTTQGVRDNEGIDRPDGESETEVVVGLDHAAEGQRRPLLSRRHSGAREARARNPLRLASCRPMDSGLAPKRARPGMTVGSAALPRGRLSPPDGRNRRDRGHRSSLICLASHAALACSGDAVSIARM